MTEEEQKAVNAEEEGGYATRVTELETLLATRDEELTKSNARLAGMEQELAESEQRLSTVTDGLKQAVSSYRSLVVKSNPGIMEELIKGDSVADIDLSLQSARELVGKVRAGLEAERAAPRVPAGAPVRSALTVAALSPREKIQQGIEKAKY
jgi:uncharacterized coiled-coil protein SlyX